MEEVDKGSTRGECFSVQKMDEERRKNVSYQYLCHLEEAKKWVEACINEELPEAGELEEQLRHGVYLAKLANFFAPDTVPLRRIYDPDLSRYRSIGLTFRHTDNINHFLKALEKIKLPSIFYPETTDVYDRKNMPRVIFCLHALSLYLFRLGIAPQIQNLYGKVNFSEEVMRAMMAELNKYGCQLPQFGKIGGILASELPVDEAALHAAVIAVNEAIDKADNTELLETLCNTSCHLQDVLEDNADSYLQCLSDAKMHKKEMAVNKSRDQDYIPDAYDELLTQAEIQGHITYVNAFCALERVEDAVKDENAVALIQALNSSLLSLKGVKNQLSEEYLRTLGKEIAEPKKQSGNQSFNCSFNSSLLTATLSKTTIQAVVNTVNMQAEREQQMNCSLSAVNKSLESGSPSATLSALKALGSNIPSVLEFAAPLYHEEMAAIREDAQCDLSLEEVQGGIRLLSAVARVNAALDTNSPSQLWLYLSDTATHLQNLEKSHSREYLAAMIKLQQAKTSANELCPLLTYFDLQQLIDEVNEQLLEDNNKVGALTDVNRAVSACNVNETMTALQHPALKLSSLCSQDALHYFQLLKVLCKAKCEMLGDTEAELWLEDIEEVVEAVGRHARESIRAAITLSALNKAFATEDDNAIIRVLRSQDLAHLRVKENYIPEMVAMLKEEYKEKNSMAGHCSWVLYTLGDGSKVHLNVDEGRYQWERPEEKIGHRTSYITHQDLEKAASFIMRQDAYNKKLDHMMVKLQARARGYLIRQKLQKQQKAVISIQSWWRMVRARRTYVMYCKALKLWEPYIIKLQRAVRVWLHRRRLRKLSQYFVRNVKQVVVIQRAWRAHKARQDLHSLTHQVNPPLPVIRKFIHLLDVSPADLDEEFRLQRLKSDMVKTIRHTHQLETEVDELDVKIGLLVHNRITLQDVLPIDKENMNPNIVESKPKKSKKASRDTIKFGTMRSQKGLKALKKESREKLLGYQHLFYLLQTQPRYLATLIFALPPGKTTKFIENVIFTLHNYGANDRDNYLLLKLFKTALEEEIRCKVLRLTDIVSGNPLVVKMIVSFNRRGHGQASLRDMLGPLIHKVLSDNNMQINTNPVEIYKTWINQLEMNTGQASGLPYSVNQDQAMQYPEVQKRLANAITKLKEVTLAFCEQITSNRDHLIPYAMLYMARVMRSALQRRFPHIPEKEILKVVGNLVYYRYINSAIVAPDAYDIVTVSPDEKLNNNQRRNLASIAKILQFAASKKGFGDEASHLQCLNPFIIECHEQFKGFFRDCCEVEEPEVVYSVTKYSEAMLIVKPTIYITVQEICETHQLLLDNEEILAPDSDDPLHTLLSELGERPSVHALVGENIDVESGTLGRMEVCLALTNKFEVTDAAEEKEPKDANKIFIRTKQMLIDVIRCVEGGVIGKLVCGPTLPTQEEIYRTIIITRGQQEHRARLNHTELNQSTSFQVDNRVSLHEVKTRLSHNLRRLENQGIVTRSDNYQAILNAIAADIVNQRQHRISRKTDVQKMVATAKQLEKKEGFYKEQLDSYHTYLKTCLANIAARNKNVHQAWTRQGGGEKARSKQAIKYTAVKLMEKGVLLEVKDLPDSQQKNLMFEITPLATTGFFHVQAKFMGVPMENVEIDIQELLQLQYEGISVKKMFSKVKVNVNLLLHLLNTKFYSKKK